MPKLTLALPDELGGSERGTDDGDRRGRRRYERQRTRDRNGDQSPIERWFDCWASEGEGEA